MDGERRFLERLAELLPRTEDLKSTTVPPRVRVIDERRPSFLLQGGCLVQVEIVYPDKTKVFWCLFFDSEKDAVVEPFLNHKTSVPEIIERVEKARGAECIRIDPETVRDYVMEFINYELAYAGEAGLLVNDLEP